MAAIPAQAFVGTVDVQRTDVGAAVKAALVKAGQNANFLSAAKDLDGTGSIYILLRTAATKGNVCTTLHHDIRLHGPGTISTYRIRPRPCYILVKLSVKLVIKNNECDVRYVSEIRIDLQKMASTFFRTTTLPIESAPGRPFSRTLQGHEIDISVDTEMYS